MKKFYGFLLFTICILPISITITLFGYIDEYATGFRYIGYPLMFASLLTLIIFFVRYFQNKTYKKLQENILHSNISQIDQLNPYNFEEWVVRLMHILGYNAKVVKKSEDCGLDVIAENDCKRIGVQVKKFNQAVGIKAIQEVISGITNYNCSEGWVITSANSFTAAAINLASKNNIKLFAKNDLALLLNQLQQNKNIDISSLELNLVEQEIIEKETIVEDEKIAVKNNKIENKTLEKFLILKFNNKDYCAMNNYCNDFTCKVVEYFLNKFQNDIYFNYKVDNIPYIYPFISNGKFICKKVFELLDIENEKSPIYDLEFVKLNAIFYAGMGSVYIWNTRNNFDINEAVDILIKKNGIQYLDETVLNKFKISIESEEWKSFNENFYKYQIDLLNDFDIDYIFHENDLNSYYDCMHAIYILGMVLAIEKLNL